MPRTVPVEQLAYGVREVESGGVKGDRYKVVNSIGAHGAYQVMRANIAPWTKELFGRAYTPQEFLNSPGAQDKLAQFRLGRDQKKYNSWESAAAVWFSGQPNPNSTSSDGGNTVRQYVDKVREAMAGGKSLPAAGTTTPGTAEQTGLTDSLLGVLGGVTAPLAQVGTSLLSVGKFAEFLLKLALPSTWVRIVCGLLGGAFLVFGLVVLGREAKGT